MVRVLSWNVERAFGDPRRCCQLVRKIIRLKPDIGFFPEAYLVETGHCLDEAQLKQAGYVCMHIPYGTVEAGEPVYFLFIHQRDLAVNVRLAHSHCRHVCIAEITTPNGLLRIVCLHLDHRSEEARLAMLDALHVERLFENLVGTVFVGDFNAMPRGWRRWLLQHKISSFLAERLPLRELRSLAAQLRSTATGRVMTRLLEEYSLTDAIRQPTIKPHRWLPCAIVQLDYVLHNGLANVTWCQMIKSLLTDHYGAFCFVHLRSKHS